MLNIIKVILFVIVNIAGFYVTPVIAHVAIKIDMFPQLPVGEHSEYFKLLYFAGGPWVWIASAVISIGYFFTKDELKNWLLLAPMYLTGIYCTLVLIYFNFFYTIH
ncbi:MAG: hypothetical protein H6867_03905 [Rhodospirillales bacterium]|nr:hypothetical protein [Rhodospirillales bacterium]MCB9996295.1 hypothetical protein [Rhodospirillales bacterium]